MEALSASMGVCGSVGAGLGTSPNVTSMKLCSDSPSTFTTPCICGGKRQQTSVNKRATERVTETKNETDRGERRRMRGMKTSCEDRE